MVALAYQPEAVFTVEEYFDVEEQSSQKHEYFDSHIIAMAGSSPAHSVITFNLSGIIAPQLRGGPCGGHSSDQRVKISGTNDYVYPDLTIVCGEPQFDEQQRATLINPTVIIEVLSPSTQAYDRGDKFVAYRTLDSLRDYLLVSQDSLRVEHFARQSEDAWLLRDYQKPEDECVLTGAQVRLKLSEIYDRVEFDTLLPPRTSPMPDGEGSPT